MFLVLAGTSFARLSRMPTFLHRCVIDEPNCIRVADGRDIFRSSWRCRLSTHSYVTSPPKVDGMPH